MQQFYVASGFVLAILLVLGHAAVAEADCHLPEDNEIVSLMESTYTSDVTITLVRQHGVCMASGMYRHQWRSASFLVRYSCTPVASCERGAEVQKEMLDIRCEDGAWSVNGVMNATPATTFDTPLFTNCSSCASPTEIEDSDEEHHCVGKDLLFTCNRVTMQGWQVKLLSNHTSLLKNASVGAANQFGGVRSTASYFYRIVNVSEYDIRRGGKAGYPSRFWAYVIPP